MLILETKNFKSIGIKQLLLFLPPLLVLCLNFFARPTSLADVEAISEWSLFHCPFHWLTGWLCPGCGMTRSLIAFFTGHWGYSIHFNPFGPLMGLVLIYFWYHINFKKTDWHFPQWLRPWLPLLSFVVVLWGIFRNLDY